ncbi:MAG: cation diffusion facilitator family transporter [Bacteroidota bacterium]
MAKSKQIKLAINTVWFSIVGNTLLAIIKLISGVLGNSYALVADAIESIGDVFSSAIVLFGLRYSTKPPDENHPYGHGKAEALVTFITVGFLLISASIIAVESVKHILTPHQSPKWFTLIVLGGIVLYKELSFQFVLRRSKKTNSSALKADAWHHRSDAITSVAAMIGISISLLMGPGWESADDWAALFAAGFICFNAYHIFRPALGEIMDEHNYLELVHEIRAKAIKVEGILGTEKCYIRKTGMHYLVDLHATVDGSLSVNEGHEIAHKLKDYLMHELPQIANILIHVEPTNCAIEH